MKDRWMYAIVFALAFASFSWIAPATYFAFAPAEHTMDIRDISVDIEEDTHYLNVEYYASGEYPVEAEIILFKTGNNGADVSVQRWSVTGFLEQGTHTTDVDLKQDTALEEGKYYYELNVRYHPGYNVERTVTARSDPFKLVNKTNESEQSGDENK